MMNFGESPALDDVLVDYHDRIIYTRLLAGEQAILGLDTPHRNAPTTASAAAPCPST